MCVCLLFCCILCCLLFLCFFTFVTFFPSVLWYSRLGLLTCKTVTQIAYTVLVEALTLLTYPEHIIWTLTCFLSAVLWSSKALSFSFSSSVISLFLKIPFCFSKRFSARSNYLPWRVFFYSAHFLSTSFSFLTSIWIFSLFISCKSQTCSNLNKTFLWPWYYTTSMDSGCFMLYYLNGFIVIQRIKYLFLCCY